MVRLAPPNVDTDHPTGSLPRTDWVLQSNIGRESEHAGKAGNP